LEIDHALKSAGVMTKQLEEYAILEGTIEEQIASAKANITNLQETLKQEQIIRHHRLQCEEIAVDVNSLPSRSILKRKISQTECSIDTTQELLNAADVDIQLKRAQFDAVLLAISDLQKCSADEDKDKNVLPDNETADQFVDDDAQADRDDGRSSRMLHTSQEIIPLNPVDSDKYDDHEEMVEDEVVPEEDDGEQNQPAKEGGEGDPEEKSKVISEKEEEQQQPAAPMEIEAGEELE